MKKRKLTKLGAVRNVRSAPAATREPAGTPAWKWILLAAAALVAGLIAYGPALSGPFLYDDRYLPFFSLNLTSGAIWLWLRSVRPFLMLSYWLNYQASGISSSQSYHVVNVVLHVLNSALVFVIARWFLLRCGADARRVTLLSLFGAAVYLFHPLQTESVAYIAGRSEVLAVLPFYGGLALFLYFRRGGISWLVATGVLVLFAVSQLTKEYAVALPVLLLLTDVFFPIPNGTEPGKPFESVKRNWRLYSLIGAGAVAGLAFVLRTLASSNSAGFGVQGVTPVDYFFTQCRAIWGYLLLFVLPVGQNVDHDFPLSHGFSDPFAWAGLILLLASVGLAWRYRSRYTLAAYGWLAMLVMLAPTSSIVPIADPFVEHRMYLPMLGAILVVLDFLRRWKTSVSSLAASCAAVTLLFAFATYQRSILWGDEIALWTDSVQKSPRKVRPQFQLAYSYYSTGQCDKAAGLYEKALTLAPPTYDLLYDWGEALDCAGREDAARNAFLKALQLQRSGLAYSQLAITYAKQRRYPEAMAALDRAQQLSPTLSHIYLYRGNIYYTQGDYAKAAEQFAHVQALDPNDEQASRALASARQHLAGGR